MFDVGKINRLKVLRLTPPGMYLGSEVNDDVVLLPTRLIPEGLKVDDYVEVFIYTDSEDRIIATSQTPKIRLNEIAGLEVKDATQIGAFLDWGLDKDLFVPFKEQQHKMVKGEKYLVYLYLDEYSSRLAATSKIDRFLNNEDPTFNVGDQVDLWIGDYTDLGVNVVINGQYKGLVYKNELFKKVRRGDKAVGFIKDIREDGKIDVSLQQQGFEAIDPAAQEILAKLKTTNGFLNLNDNSDPDTIKHKLQMSKKTFKKAIGALFRQRLISIEEDGIHLVKK